MILEYRLEDIGQLAEQFWKNAGGARVFAVYGPMGAGKTTTIAALCAARGVQAAVSSPTFSIINEYVYEMAGRQQPLYHMDLYRLRDLEEIIAAGVEDCLNSGAICFVEWPEKAPELLEDATRLEIEVVDDQTRRLRIGSGSF